MNIYIKINSTQTTGFLQCLKIHFGKQCPREKYNPPTVKKLKTMNKYTKYIMYTRIIGIIQKYLLSTIHFVSRILLYALVI